MSDGVLGELVARIQELRIASERTTPDEALDVMIAATEQLDHAARELHRTDGGLLCDSQKGEALDYVEVLLRKCLGHECEVVLSAPCEYRAPALLTSSQIHSGGETLLLALVDAIDPDANRGHRSLAGGPLYLRLSKDRRRAHEAFKLVEALLRGFGTAEVRITIHCPGKLVRVVLELGEVVVHAESLREAYLEVEGEASRLEEELATAQLAWERERRAETRRAEEAAAKRAAKERRRLDRQRRLAAQEAEASSSPEPISQPDGDRRQK